MCDESSKTEEALMRMCISCCTACHKAASARMALLFSILQKCRVVASYKCSCAPCCRVEVVEISRATPVITTVNMWTIEWRVTHRLEKQYASEVCNNYHSVSNTAATQKFWLGYSQTPSWEGGPCNVHYICLKTGTSLFLDQVFLTRRNKSLC